MGLKIYWNLLKDKPRKYIQRCSESTW